MRWDEKADDYAVAHHTFEHLSGEMNQWHYVGITKGAKWQREQLRTDEAVDRVATAVFNADHAGSWDAAEEWMREDCRVVARRAIDALLGEES